VIRPATLADVSVILELIRALAVYEKLEGSVPVRAEDLASHLFGPRPYAECFLAEDAGAVVGFAIYYYLYSTFPGRPGIYLEDLFVRSEYRGRGLGKSLLAALAAMALEKNCCRMEWSVLDWNAPAIAFYESLGAAPHGGWTTYRLSGDALAALAR